MTQEHEGEEETNFFDKWSLKYNAIKHSPSWKIINIARFSEIISEEI